MEFLQTLLSYAPVTTSSLIIVLALVVIACASVIFLKGVNFTLNSESWGKEVIDSGVLFDKLHGLLYKKESVVVFIYAGYNYKLLNTMFGYVFHDGNDYLKDSPYDESSVKTVMSKPEAKTFKNKEQAIKWLKTKGRKHSTVDEVLPRFSAGKLLLIPLIDLCLFTFTLAPLLTITVVSTATLVMSVRWVSGKLANNVKNTDNNTKRIDDIEEKLKDE
ncbi:hypothetical protein [Pseudoalteromonas phage PH357]|nr:hypothetical protein [Pseudoalteromonas phage PH357]